MTMRQVKYIQGMRWESDALLNQKPPQDIQGKRFGKGFKELFDAELRKLKERKKQ